MRPGAFIIGIILIISGALLTLLNLGYISWFTIDRVVGFWPVLLIIAGLALFFDRNVPRWVALIVVVLIAFGILYIVWGGVKVPGCLYREVFLRAGDLLAAAV